MGEVGLREFDQDVRTFDADLAPAAVQLPNPTLAAIGQSWPPRVHDMKAPFTHVECAPADGQLQAAGLTGCRAW